MCFSSSSRTSGEVRTTMSKAVTSGSAPVGPVAPSGVRTGSTFCGGGSGGGAVCVTLEGGVETAVMEELAGCAGVPICALAAGTKKIARRASARLVAGRVQWVLGWVTASSLLEHYLDSKRIASSSPLMVNGYMRWPTSCWITLMLWRYCQTPCGSGLIQANLGKALVSRCSHSEPASSLLYSTLPPGCKISYGLMVASPMKISL